MIIYISGSISGDKDYKKKFERVENKLKAEGNIVLNPAVLPKGMPEESYLPICFAMMEQADAIYMQSDWIYSKGAFEELKKAILDHMEVIWEVFED